MFSLQCAGLRRCWNRSWTSTTSTSLSVPSVLSVSICNIMRHSCNDSRVLPAPRRSFMCWPSRCNPFPPTIMFLVLILAFSSCSSRWTDSLLNGTAVYRAIDVARSSRSCLQIYRRCRWPQFSKGGVWQRAWPNMLQLFSGKIF